MIQKTVVEAVALLLLALCIALLHHALSSSGITIFKKRPAVQSSTTLMLDRGGALHGR